MSSKKVSTADLFESVTQRVGTECDAAITIVKNGDQVEVAMTGIDAMMVGSNAVSLASTMNHVLETRLRTARDIGLLSEKHGITSTREISFETAARNAETKRTEPKRPAHDHINPDEINPDALPTLADALDVILTRLFSE